MAPPHSQRHSRRSIRLREHDYSEPGTYFITICTHEREPLFGHVAGGIEHLSEIGGIAEAEWARSGDIRSEIVLDAYIVMPNHLHGIVLIEDVGAHGRAPLPAAGERLRRQPRSIGSFVAGFKAAASKRINALRETPGQPVWQRNYYEHIVRSEAELDGIREYILNNPASWAEDEYYAV